MLPAIKRPESHMPIKLKALLQRHRLTQLDVCAAVLQTTGEPMGETAMNLLCNWAQWPKRTPEASIREQVGNFLRTQGVPEDEIATAFDPHSDTGRGVNQKNKSHPLHAVDTTDTNEPDPYLLEPVMLTAQAKRHFKLMFNPFGADPQCADDVYLGDEQRYVASVIVEAIQNARMIGVAGESGKVPKVFFDYVAPGSWTEPTLSSNIADLATELTGPLYEFAKLEESVGRLVNGVVGGTYKRQVLTSALTKVSTASIDGIIERAIKQNGGPDFDKQAGVTAGAFAEGIGKVVVRVNYTSKVRIDGQRNKLAANFVRTGGMLAPDNVVTETARYVELKR